MEKIKALKIHQWLNEWKGIEFKKENLRKKPKEFFYVFSLSAKKLKLLSGVYRRGIKSGISRTSDKHIQRQHEPSRSANIREYIKYGYPWSELSGSKRKEEVFNNLRKPGWLPTAIVVNILGKADERNDMAVDKNDLIEIEENSTDIEVILPRSFKGKNWKPKKKHPIEIIDGQHRLLAFDDKLDDENYQLPVVAFHELDISWQAYLFWTINIKPKRINPSLAYDLYPLLRTEDWLDRFEGHKVYREARAQEITESLWYEQESVWYHRINMLGEGGAGAVTQAAWIRALLKSYIKSYEGKGVSIGGLYGARVGEHKIIIPWTRTQQAAFLIYLWNRIKYFVEDNNSGWAKDLRGIKYKKQKNNDPAFDGPHSLLNNDQGVSVVLNVTNDIFFEKAVSLNLKSWKLSDVPDAEISVNEAIKDLKRKKKIIDFIDNLTQSLSKFDWRSSGAPNLEENERLRKLAFRGGSGYREFRRQLLRHLMVEKTELGTVAKNVFEHLGFNR
ncbi:MAG: DGQHR domain-containing protein [Candidatus Omnitrophota bacterium]